MPDLFRFFFFSAIALALMAVVSGCSTATIGDTSYNQGNLSVSLVNAGQPSPAFIQVTAYKIAGFSQSEYTTVSIPVDLAGGPYTLTVPIDLPAGSYKIYIYLIENGERQTAVIRDITV